MRNISHRKLVTILLFLPFAAGLAQCVLAQDTNSFPSVSTFFTPGNLVVSVEGCGIYGGTCAGVPNGTGNGTGNSSNTGYGDNEAAPLTLFQYAPSGTSSATYVNSLVFPQTGSGANLPIAGEYGSSSEGTVQLDGTGRYLTVMGYGINAATFDAAYHPATPPGDYTPCGPDVTDDPYGAAPSGALAQSGSLTGQCYTPVARVITLTDPYGNVNSSTAIENIFNTNNPRSIYTLDGSTVAYVSGQGSGCDGTGGVFYVPLFTTTTNPTAITGNDTVGGNNGCPGTTNSTLLSEDTRDVQIYNNTLYISMDSTEGTSYNRSLIGSLGTPPSITLYTDPSNPGQIGPGNTGPLSLSGFGNGKTGKITITTGAGTNGNSLNNSTSKVNGVALDLVNLSPVNYFFASPSVLYVTDSGHPKNDSNGDNDSSGADNIGDGGLQKWVNSASNGTGTWSLKYTLYLGLGLVNNGGASGTTGLYGLAGVVNGANVNLYVTNYNISDLDPTYLYGITDTLATTSNPGTTFTKLAAAPSDSNFKGVSFAPSLPAGSATITSSPSGITVTTSGTGCAPGSYPTPVTSVWTPSSPCQLSVVSPQTVNGTQYVFSQWQDGTTATTDSVTAPTTAAVYSASFLIAQSISFTADSPVTYGVSPIALSATGGASGIPVTFSLDAASTPGAASLSGPNNSTLTITGAGTVVVDANQGGNSTYAAATQVQQSIVVNKAPLTVTANNASMAAGAALPTFTATYSGFVNNDNSSVVGGSPAFSTTATSSSPAGLYPINVASGTLSAANYSFTTFVPGTLSNVQAPTVIITTSAVLSGSNSGGYTAAITVKNTGTGAASDVSLNTATLGSTTGSPLPQSVASIPAGGSTVFSVSFPGSAGLDGAGVSEKYSGTYTGGSFAASVRSVTLP